MTDYKYISYTYDWVKLIHSRWYKQEKRTFSTQNSVELVDVHVVHENDRGTGVENESYEIVKCK